MALFDSIFNGMATLAGSGSPERQNVPLGSSNIWDIFGGSKSSSGVMINNETVLGYPAVWRGVNLLATQVAKVPAITYKRLPQGGKERDKKHPAYRLLRNRPNSEMTSYTFISTLMGHALLHRGGYAWISRSGAGDPLEMIILDPMSTWPLRVDGELMYRTLAGGRELKIPKEDMFHIKGLSFDGLTGYSVIDKLRESLGLGLAMQKYGSVYFANNARPNMIIELPGHLKDEGNIKRFRTAWGDKHKSIENAHRPAVLEDGAKVSAFSVNHEDAQFLESREFEVRQIANILGVPPHKLADPSRTSFASLEQENQSFLDDALDPWMRNIEEEANAKLLRERERENDTHTVEFLRQALVRADIKTRFEVYGTGILNGILTRNEARERENLNPIPGGDDVLVPLNMGQPDGEEGKEPKQPEDNSKPFAALRTLMIDALARMTRRVGVHAVKASKKPGSYHEWLDGMQAEHSMVFGNMVWPTVATIRAVAGQCRAGGELKDQFFRACHVAYLEAGDGDPAQFGDRVEQVAARLQDELPANLADSVIYETKRYQVAEEQECQTPLLST